MSKISKNKNMSNFKISLMAGPLWSNDEAQELGPRIAAAHLCTFTGNWKTIVANEMSIIQVEMSTQNTGSTEYVMDVLAGPIWNNEDANKVCPAICRSYGGEWNGQWKTVVEGKMSVCGCIFRF